MLCVFWEVGFCVSYSYALRQVSLRSHNIWDLHISRDPFFCFSGLWHHWYTEHASRNIASRWHNVVMQKTIYKVRLLFACNLCLLVEASKSSAYYCWNHESQVSVMLYPSEFISRVTKGLPLDRVLISVHTVSGKISSLHIFSVDCHITCYIEISLKIHMHYWLEYMCCKAGYNLLVTIMTITHIQLAWYITLSTLIKVIS